MPKAPTTYDALRNAVRTEREALTLAAVLPNIYENECVVDVRGHYDRYADDVFFETPDDELDALRRNEPPIVPDTDLYRVQMHTVYPGESSEGEYGGILPIPHGRRVYDVNRHDLVEFVRVDPEDADYDIPYATLDEFGAGNPYLNPWYANRDAFDREPHLPV